MKTTRAIVKPCDEVINGKDVRTWDVVRAGICVASGFRTRIEARVEAKRLNDAVVVGAVEPTTDAVVRKAAAEADRRLNASFKGMLP